MYSGLSATNPPKSMARFCRYELSLPSPQSSSILSGRELLLKYCLRSAKVYKRDDSAHPRREYAHRQRLRSQSQCPPPLSSPSKRKTNRLWPDIQRNSGANAIQTSSMNFVLMISSRTIPCMVLDEVKRQLSKCFVNSKRWSVSSRNRRPDANNFRRFPTSPFILMGLFL